uniref:Uncharacterized protein n=1 Tax=Hyaloperonospora arabidopsidis (strain Emoy2) TaxID=559515 RepID=M4BE58_HYAAE
MRRFGLLFDMATNSENGVEQIRCNEVHGGIVQELVQVSHIGFPLTVRPLSRIDMSSTASKTYFLLVGVRIAVTRPIRKLF